MSPTLIKKALVVDSDPDVSRKVASWLLGEDIEVISAPDGEAGFMRFKRESPSVIIIAAQLDKVVGSVLCRRIRSHPEGKETVIILASERYSDHPELGVRAVSMFGANAYLTKPMTREAVLKVLKPLLASAKPPPEQPPAPQAVSAPSVNADQIKTAEAERKAESIEQLPELPVEPETDAVPKHALFRGSLSSTPLTTIILNLCDLKRNGVLTIERNRIKREIFMSDGAIAHVSSALRQENPALMLVENGIITEEDYSKSLLAMSHEGKTLNEALVAVVPSLTYEALYAYVKQYERQILVACFSWNEGHFEFLPMDKLPENIPSFDYKPLAIIFDGIRKYFSLKRLSGPVHENMDLYMSRTQRFAELVDQFELDTRQLKFALLINGKRKTRELVSLGRDNLTETYQLIWMLAHSKMICFADQPQESADSEFLAEDAHAAAKKQPLPPELMASIMREYYRVKSSNYFRVLGVDHRAQNDEIMAAFEKIEQKFHPDNLSDYDVKPVLGKLNDILEKALASRRVLLDERTRREYRHYLDMQERQRAKDESLQAEIVFKEGERAMVEMDYLTAKAKFENAIRLKPDEPEYYAYMGLTLFQLARSSQNAEDVKKAKQFLNKAIAMNPDSDKALMILGRIFAGEGNLELAKQHFERALKSNPSCHPAQKALEILEKACPRNGDGGAKPPENE